MPVTTTLYDLQKSHAPHWIIGFREGLTPLEVALRDRFLAMGVIPGMRVQFQGVVLGAHIYRFGDWCLALRDEEARLVLIDAKEEVAVTHV